MKQSEKVHVLLLDSANDGLSVVVARSLQRAGGYRIHCLSHVARHDIRFSLRSRFRHEPLDTPERLMTALRNYTADHSVDVVIPVHEDLIKMCGRQEKQIRAFTTLAPIPSHDLCERVDNKWLFYELMTAAGIQTPESRLPDDRRLPQGEGPWILKPFFGEGGSGIRRFDSREELLAELKKQDPASGTRHLIQPCIPGIDMGCSFISLDGRVIACTVQKTVVNQSRPYSSGLAIDFVEHDAIAAIARDFARKHQWSGVANMDLRLDERNGEIHMLEVNPRYWQTLLGSLAMGINFPDLHCRLARGLPVKPMRAKTGHWINVHTISYDLANLKALKPHIGRACCTSAIREFLADPLLETFFVCDGLRRFARSKTSALRRRLKRLLKAEQPGTAGWP